MMRKIDKDVDTFPVLERVPSFAAVFCVATLEIVANE